MPRNESSFDRILRVVLGVAVFSLAFLGPRTAWGWLGLVPLMTGLVGYCPMYRLVGIDTCQRRSGGGGLGHQGA